MKQTIYHYQNIISDDTGLYKVFRDCSQILKLGSQANNRKVLFISNNNQSILSSLLHNNTIEIFDISSLKQCKFNPVDNMLKTTLYLKDNGKYTGFYHFSTGNRIIFCTNSGKVYSLHYNTDSQNNESNFNISLYSNINKNNISCMTATDTCMALAGIEVTPSLHSTDTGQLKWNAKRPPNDYLQLKVPLQDTNISFIFPDRDDIFVTSSSLHKLHLYDTKAGKRPVKVYDIGGESSIFSLCVSNNSGKDTIYVGDGIGKLYFIDYSAFQTVGTVQYSHGVIKSIASCSNTNLLATGGYDKYLNIIDTKSKSLVNRIFCNQKLTNVLFSDFEILTDDSETSDDKRTLEIWNKLINDEPPSKLQKIN